jgi:hypothetical protein
MVNSTVELACKGHKHGVGDQHAQTRAVMAEENARHYCMLAPRRHGDRVRDFHRE